VLGTMWRDMFVFAERSVNIILHGNIDVFLFVIPLEVHAAVRVACPVDGAFVVCLYGGDEVLCVVSTKVFNAEVVDAECECCSSLFVFPYSRRVFERCVSIR